MSYRVIFFSGASEAIFDCANYIAVEREAPENAERWLEHVGKAVDSLKVLPNGFPLAPENEFRPYDIRMRIIGKHVLLFTVVESKKLVWVVGFRHGAQLPQSNELPDDVDEID